jgi:hypothetical protein
MAIKEYFHDIDLQKVSQLVNARVQNITTADRTTLAGTLNTTHKGLQVWDTDLNSPYFWTGSAFIAGISTVVGAMIYRGAYSNLTTLPTTPAIGDVYVMTAAGTLTWAGQTFNPSAVVQVNDQVVYRGTNVWDVLQGNAVEATEASLGLVELATQAEVNAGADATRSITPATLTSFVNTKALAKTYFSNSITTVANTPLTVTHNLGLQNKDAFTISVKSSTGSEVSVDVDSVDVNSLTITTGVALTTGKVCIIGF